MADKILINEKKVLRNGITERLIHWVVALSTFILIFSGFGQMPMYKRYLVDTLPGLAWTSNYHITLNIHYLAAIVFVFAITYHLVYHGMRKDRGIMPRKGDFKESVLIIKAMITGGKEPDSHKYVAEQRLAYAFIGINLIVIAITGMVKVIKNLPGVEMSNTLISIATNFHNLATILIILGIIGHFGAFVVKANRSLLPSMLSGKVDLDYVKHRHSLWFDELEKKNNKEL